MSLWITIRRSVGTLAVLMAGLALFGLGCGGHKSMESGKTDEEIAQTQASDGSDTAVKLSGEDENASASFEEKKAAADAERAAKVASVPSGSTRSGEGKLESVTVRKGDTLWSLAQRKDVYGSGWLYPLILKANKAKIKDPNNLPAGLKLVVPRDVPDPQVEIAKEQAMTNELLEPAEDAAPKPALAKAPEAAPVAAPAAPVKAPRKGHRGLLLLLVLALGAGALVWRSKRKDESA